MNIKIFVTKLDIFTKDLEKKFMKYFPQLQKHFKNSLIFENALDIQGNAINRYLIIIREIKQVFQSVVRSTGSRRNVFKIYFSLFYIHKKRNLKQ